jgi:hypothetical protein
MSKAKRKILDVEVNEYFDFSVIDGKTFDQIIQEMEKLKLEFEGRDVYFEISYYGYDGGKELKLRERRLENDKEFAKRREAEAKDREKEKLRKRTNAEKEFAEYQRLQKKFQGKTVF